MTTVRLNPNTNGYHMPSCIWLANGAKTDHGKYVDIDIRDLPSGAKPGSPCAPPAPPRSSA